MFRCKEGICKLTNNDICCKECELLERCVEEWTKDVNGLEHEDYFLCTNFNLKCDNIYFK